MAESAINETGIPTMPRLAAIATPSQMGRDSGQITENLLLSQNAWRSAVSMVELNECVITVAPSETKAPALSATRAVVCSIDSRNSRQAAATSEEHGASAARLRIEPTAG